MNLVTELENELINTLLVEKKSIEKINSDNALALIDKIKSVLQPNLVAESERETNLLARRSASFFSR